MSKLQETNCPSCFIAYAVPEGFLDERIKSGKAFYCPNGHRLTYGDGEADRLRRERDRLAQQVAQRDDEIKRQREFREAAERREAAQKANVTKLKKRASGGVCPCCNRTFLALQKHMAQKHPNFACDDASNVVTMPGAKCA